MTDDTKILSEWQETHAELTGQLMGTIESVLRECANHQKSLPPVIRQQLDILAKAYAAYSEHMNTTAEAGGDDTGSE